MLIRRDAVPARALRPFAVPRSPVQVARIGPHGEGGDAVQADNPHDVELARLQGQVEALEAALEEAKTVRETAVELALEKGREEGRRAADEFGAERLEALRDELAKASRDCLSQLNEKSDLAIEIARAAIHKILGEASPRGALAEEIVRNAIAQIAGGTVVAVRVSSEDFASDEELAALGNELGAVRIIRDDDLRGGGCGLDLTLGTVDASLGVQLAALDRALGRSGIGAAS